MSSSDPNLLLIARLTEDLSPVRPLRAPWWRAVVYLLWAFAFLAVVVRMAGLRPGLAEKLGQSDYLLEWLASLLTGIIAVLAAFHVSIPGRARIWRLAPWIGLVGWLSVLGAGCWRDWVRAEPQGVEIGTSFHCLQVIVSLSLPLGAVLFVMTRHAATIRPILTAVYAGLGVAALSAAALTLFHPLNASVMVLIWHGLAVALVMLTGRLIGAPALNGLRMLEQRLRPARYPPHADVG